MSHAVNKQVSARIREKTREILSTWKNGINMTTSFDETEFGTGKMP